MRQTQILLILFFLFPMAKAQEGIHHGLSSGIRYHHGFMLPEYQFINYLVNEPVRAVELSVYHQTAGKTEWEKLYRYPDYGLSLMYSTLGNHNVFGEYMAIWPWYRIHFIDSPNFSLHYRLGVGLCYASEIFDPVENYRNRAIGSHLNIFFNLEAGTRIRLYDNLWLTNGIGFSHFSNANLKEPNFGLNDLSFVAGFDWSPSTRDQRTSGTIPPVEHRTGYYVTLSAAPKHKRSFEGNRYLVSSLAFDVHYRVSHKLRIGAGADFFYDSSVKVEMEGRNNDGYRKQDDYQSGLHLSQEFIYDRLSLILQEGRYFFLGDMVTGQKIYTRGIIQFRFTNHLMARLSMKTHFFILDHPELGIGYCW
ncbi:MAG TPA: acyloxyacyl hydrolase [Bacteroidales bacterium]|nr:acyloxyacyl hydrolase [Bacteroidales bacterium]